MIIPYREEYKDAWNRFCVEHPQAWFWHTRHFLDYLAIGSQDYSFMDIDSVGLIQAIVPLVFRDGKSVDGYALPMPIIVDGAKQDCLERIMIYYSSLFAGREGFVWRVRESPLAPHWTFREFSVVEVDEFKENHSVVINLEDSEEARWKEIRKSYHSLINGARKKYELHYVSGIHIGNMSDMHAQERGGQTRNALTWIEMRKWVDSGHAILSAVCIHDEVLIVGYNLIIIYKNMAYNAVMTTAEPNLSAFMLWEAQTHLINRGVKKFEIGWCDVGESEKEKNIEFFKRGMGKQQLSWISFRLR